MITVRLYSATGEPTHFNPEVSAKTHTHHNQAFFWRDRFSNALFNLGISRETWTTGAGSIGIDVEGPISDAKAAALRCWVGEDGMEILRAAGVVR